MKLQDFFNTVNYKITEGSDFGWPCYSDHAFSLSAWNGDYEGWGATVVFDTQTQTVFEVDICDYKRSRAYRYFNPDYRDQYRTYADQHHKESADQAWDDVRFVDLEEETDWLTKAAAIVAGQDYDTKVSIPVDLDKEEWYELMCKAHEQDITLNQLVEKILLPLIHKHKDQLSSEQIKD